MLGEGEGKKTAATFPRNEESVNSQLNVLRKETDRLPQDASYKPRSAWKFPVACEGPKWFHTSD